MNKPFLLTQSLLATALKDNNIVSEYENFEILSLYEKCSTIQLERFTLGSAGSRHRTAPIVQIYYYKDSELRIAEVKYYLKFNIKVATDSGDDTKTFWFATLCRFLRSIIVKTGLEGLLRYGHN